MYRSAHTISGTLEVVYDLRYQMAQIINMVGRGNSKEQQATDYINRLGGSKVILEVRRNGLHFF